MAGIRGAAPASRYVLCLDDDVQPHPGLLAALVADMQADASLFMATGKAWAVPSGRGDSRLGAGVAAGGCFVFGGKAASGHMRFNIEMPSSDLSGFRPHSSAAGYPFDVPPPGAGLLTYAVLSYHLPLVIAFSLRQRTSFVWGGCMLFRTADLRADSQGLLKVGEGAALGAGGGVAPSLEGCC